MRIRRCASRLLGSAYSFPAPDPAPLFEQLPLPLPPPPPRPPPARPCPSATESQGWGGCFADGTASGQPRCELNRSPWDLQLDHSDPQVEEEFVETYFYYLSFRASWVVPTSMPAASVKEEDMGTVTMVDEVCRVKPRVKVAKKTAVKKAVVKKRKREKECEPKKKKAKIIKVKAEDGSSVVTGEAQLWMCKKNDGKRWFCHRLVSKPNSLCAHHSDQKRTCNSLLSESISTAAPPAASAAVTSKPSTSSKPRRKKPVDVDEGFYYYAGFGPSRSKRQCRSSSMQQESPSPAEHNKAPEHHTAPTAGEVQGDASAEHQAAARNEEPSCLDDDMACGIAGGDEESSDGEHRVVGINSDSKKKSPLKKRWRKPVKARSLKSLM